MKALLIMLYVGLLIVPPVASGYVDLRDIAALDPAAWLHALEGVAQYWLEATARFIQEIGGLFK